ncbi:hypothetical protein C8R44DRAFT_529502, partial [Mycena epipterygia]
KIQNEMPLWHHPGENQQKRQENNGRRAKCLRRHHTALTVGDSVELTERLQSTMHETHARCKCEDCEEDRTQGCTNPHACATAAAARLRQILPKWVP